MIARPLLLTALLATLLAATQAQAAGVVEVRFVEPQKYTDAGFGSFDIERTTRSLSEHFRWLGQRLPDGQTLSIDVLDVDLAGNLQHRRTGEVRVIRGGLDAPKITLRYTLSVGDRTLAQGEEAVTDINYRALPRRGVSHNNLPYEERLLTQWFDNRFGAAAQAQ